MVGNAIMETPFADIGGFALEESGGGGRLPTDESLPEASKQISDEMLREAEMRGMNTALEMVAKQVSRVGGILGGISSEDLTIEVDPESGTSVWSISQEKIDEIEQKADLGTAEKEYMVYQRKKNSDSGSPQYGFDYVRSVASTEE